MNDLGRGSVRDSAIEACTVVSAYCVLTWTLLFPVFASPARAVFDPTGLPDGWLTAPVVNWGMWALAWGWHILTTAPWKLFDANIFHPIPLALATSQPLLGQLPLFGPVYALTGNVVLGYQTNLLLDVSLCGATMYALLRHWGVNRAAAFFGGFVYAYCPIRLESLAQIHLLASQYFPLVLLFLDRALLSPRLRHWLLLLAFLLLQILCSRELAYLTLIALIGYGAGVLWATRGRLSPRGVALALAAVLIATVAANLLRLPRLHLAELGLLSASDWLDWARLDSTGWLTNYLYPPFALRWWGWELTSGPSVYVGFLPLGCAILALRRRHPGAAGESGPVWVRPAVLGLIAVSYFMALGPQVEVAGTRIPSAYQLALGSMPDFSTSTTPARFGLFFMVGGAALAGLGLSRLLGRLRRFPTFVTAWGVTALVLLGTAVEYDLPFRHYPTRVVDAGVLLPAAYQVLAKAPRGPVLEVPAATCDLSDAYLESHYAVSSAFHWQPLINGYGDRPPITRDLFVALAGALPDARATTLFGRMAGVRYVLVHLDKLRHGERGRWHAPPGLKLAGFFGSDLLFEVEDPPAPDLQGPLMQIHPRKETLLGASLHPLPAQGRSAKLAPAVPLPDPVNASLEFKADVLVTNLSKQTWPALALGPGSEHRVELAYRWEDEEGNIFAGNSAAAPLPYDLEPGDSLVASLCVAAPADPGVSRLVIGLAQDGEWFPDTTAALPVTVVPVVL